MGREAIGHSDDSECVRPVTLAQKRGRHDVARLRSPRPGPQLILRLLSDCRTVGSCRCYLSSSYIDLGAIFPAEQSARRSRQDVATADRHAIAKKAQVLKVQLDDCTRSAASGR